MWHMSEGEPLTFQSVDEPKHRLFKVECGWEIADPSGVTVARAVTGALHPTTTYPCEWMTFSKTRDGSYTDMRFHHLSLDTSEDSPTDMEFLGWDFFAVYSLSKPIWFISPVDGTVRSTTCKRTSDGKTGVKYCHFCRSCFSSNNWKQHMGAVHPKLPRGGTVAEIIRHVLDEPPPVPRPPGHRRVIIRLRRGRRTGTA